MSQHKKIHAAKSALGKITGEFLAKEVREVLADFEKPEWLNEHVVVRPGGQGWMTVKEVKATYGDNYAKDQTLIRQMIGTYMGRAIRHAILEAGLNPNALSAALLIDIASVTDEVEHDAYVRLTSK